MDHWWVNHKQTNKEEISGGYIWSPQTKSNGSRHISYDNLTRTSPGDLVFSYAKGEIGAIGLVTEKYRLAEKPSEFGSKGEQWDLNGFLVKVRWFSLNEPLVPRDHLSRISPFLPAKHSPLQPSSGRGNQGVYLASISEELSGQLLDIIRLHDSDAIDRFRESYDQVEEEREQNRIIQSPIPQTTKEQLILARSGQGLFRKRVMEVEKGCRLTGTEDSRFLIASHIKPWRYSTDQERLDGNNGLILSPHVDKLFDSGCISFTNEGDILLANGSIKKIMDEWGLDYSQKVGAFNAKQKEYLAFHRSRIYQGSPLHKKALSGWKTYIRSLEKQEQ